MLTTIILSSILIFIFLAMSSYWAIVFMRGIRLSILYQRGAARNATEGDSGYSNKQYCYHYETKIWEYVYLLSINSAEVLGSIFNFTEYLIKEYLSKSIKQYDYSLEQCGDVNNSNTYLYNFQLINSSITLVNVIMSFGKVSDIMVVTLGICLMNYLAKRFKKVRSLPGTLDNTKFLLVTFVISIPIISSAVVHSFLILGRVLFLITITIYFGLFVKTIKQFELTLFTRAVQHLAQYGSNKEELKQHKYFTYTSTLVYIGFLSILVSIYLDDVASIFTSVFFYNKCFFPFNLFSLNTPILKPEDINAIITTLKVLIVINYTFGYIGVFLVVVPFVLITLFTWCNVVCEKFRNKPNKYRFRGHDLTECLINTANAPQLREGTNVLILKGLVK